MIASDPALDKQSILGRAFSGRDCDLFRAYRRGCGGNVRGGYVRRRSWADFSPAERSAANSKSCAELVRRHSRPARALTLRSRESAARVLLRRGGIGWAAVCHAAADGSYGGRPPAGAAVGGRCTGGIEVVGDLTK